MKIMPADSILKVFLYFIQVIHRDTQRVCELTLKTLAFTNLERETSRKRPDREPMSDALEA